MHIKELHFGETSRSELLKGINLAADAISSTMGYLGRNVIYETIGGKPKSTKDGVTVSQQVFLEEPLHSLGAELLKEACNKTLNECGDSTTNTAVLAREIIVLADKEINKGAHPIEIKRGIDEATKQVLQIIKDKSKKITQKDYFNVANISANNDKELGKVVSDAFIKAGKNGKVLHDKSPNENTFVEVTDGMPIDRGYANREMINKPKTETLELENPLLFICEKEIDNIQEIRFLFEYLVSEMKQGKNTSIVIIGELSHKVEQLLSANRQQNNIQLFYIKAPSIASKRTDLMEDLSIATGAKFLSKKIGDSYEVLFKSTSILGHCKSLKATKNDTILEIDKDEFGNAIKTQIDNLSNVAKTLNNTTQKMQKEFLLERVAKLSCSVAKIMVGANSEVELNEKIDRVDDAVNALKSAIEEGVLLGGGVALLNASFSLSRNSKESDSFNRGHKIIQEAIKKPFKQILFNAGVEDIDAHEDTILNSKNDNLGFNVAKNEFSDFYNAGIIDPHKAIRCALQNASSVASTFILTNTTISIKRDASNTK